MIVEHEQSSHFPDPRANAGPEIRYKGEVAQIGSEEEELAIDQVTLRSCCRKPLVLGV